MLCTCPKERLKFWDLMIVCLSRTGKNRVGQVDPLDTFPKERPNYFVNPEQSTLPNHTEVDSSPVISLPGLDVRQDSSSKGNVQSFISTRSYGSPC